MRHERLGVTPAVAERKTGSAVYARRNDAGGATTAESSPLVQPLLALRSAGGRAAPAPARASRSDSARPGPDLRLAQRPIMIASGRAQRALQISRAARLSHTDTATAKYATKARDKVAQFQAPGFSESV